MSGANIECTRLSVCVRYLACFKSQHKGGRASLPITSKKRGKRLIFCFDV